MGSGDEPAKKAPQKAKKAMQKKKFIKKKTCSKLQKMLKVQKVQKVQTFNFLRDPVTSKTKWKLLFFPLSSVKALQTLQTLEDPNTFQFRETEASKQELRTFVLKILDLRWKFRRLVLAWRFKTCKPANETDPITMDTIVDPIRLYSIPLKMYYIFEKQSLSEYWRSNLKQSDGLLPTPRWPTNPLTNLPIHRTLLNTFYNEFHSKGYTDSFFASFAETRFNMLLWKSIYQIPLRLNAVGNTFRDKDSYDCIDYTFDFVELQHDIHCIPFNKKLFNWIFFCCKMTSSVHQKSECIKNQWVTYCKLFHEKEIITLEQSELEKELNKLRPFTKKLILTSHSLINFYNEYIRERNARLAHSNS